jgi:hypothetical protein
MDAVPTVTPASNARRTRRPSRLDPVSIGSGFIEKRRGTARISMFVFFSNRFGCTGSLLVSLAATLVLVLIVKSL